MDRTGPTDIEKMAKYLQLKLQRISGVEKVRITPGEQYTVNQQRRTDMLILFSEAFEGEQIKGWLESLAQEVFPKTLPSGASSRIDFHVDMVPTDVINITIKGSPEIALRYAEQNDPEIFRQAMEGLRHR